MNNLADFTTQDTWRVFRIMSEFVEGFEVMSSVGTGVSIFGSARTPRNHKDYEMARSLGRMLAKEGFGIITGGGPGIMEAANRGAREAGGVSVGLNIMLPHEQMANPFITRRIDFRYFFVRLVMFVKYACSFVCFPGGYGTLHEFYNAMTLIQTGKTLKFPVILMGRHYWKGLVDWMKKATLEGDYPMISPQDVDLFHITDNLYEAVEIIKAARVSDAAMLAAIPGATAHSPTGEGTVAGKPPKSYSRAATDPVKKKTKRRLKE